MYMGVFDKLINGLFKTRTGFTSKLSTLLRGSIAIDDDLYDELEEILITSDIGVATSLYIIDRLKEKIKEDKVKDPGLVLDYIKNIVLEILGDETGTIIPEKTPQVMLIIGVNGVGKTTTIGKAAAKLKDNGLKVLLAAGDTFRAAAIEQLEVWGNRAGVPIVKHQEGSDPAAVIYDAIAAAKARGIDVLICDTAGRLHNKKNLMEELKKINKIIDKEYIGDKKTYLVLDATTGQNAVIQAKDFSEVTKLDGVILTKLDGTAKGGIVISIKQQLDIPVKLIGVGEGIDDLQEFDPKLFTEALFKE
ncbi:MAG: signal recognition particle-docking protein FtsY [Bacillota bacterium]|nr:signal recognition particle-docking protein FtsY [Bacillota bacterium]